MWNQGFQVSEKRLFRRSNHRFLVPKDHRLSNLSSGLLHMLGNSKECTKTLGCQGTPMEILRLASDTLSNTTSRHFSKKAGKSMSPETSKSSGSGSRRWSAEMMETTCLRWVGLVLGDMGPNPPKGFGKSWFQLKMISSSKLEKDKLGGNSDWPSRNPWLIKKGNTPPFRKTANPIPLIILPSGYD